MQGRRVVVTGLGAVTPLGNSIQQTWEGMLAGRSGIGAISAWDASSYPTRIAGEIRDFDPVPYFGSPKESRKCDPFIHYGVAAALDALTNSGLDITPENADRVGVHVGSGIGGIGTIEDTVAVLHSTGKVRKVSPFFVPSSIINMISGNISILTGAAGPNLATVTACTTGAHCIGISARLIAAGDADVMIAGGAERGSSPVGMAGFCAARALSQRNDEPTTASRPFDRERDGFVLSDGAAVLILEERDHALRRGAQILAELVGFGMSADAYHITSPRDDGDGAARCMSHALRDAGLNAEQIDYINAHGTSTQAGDVAEVRAIKRCFGDAARTLAVSSTKSMSGHLLGAAGGLEAAVCVLALRDQVLPPTINLAEPDPECDLDLVPHEARSTAVRYALSNSFGFGGTNGTLIFTHPS
ncbi:MAG: beta-ketoacyl-ACP synthase II [Oceanococcaceae bacterium]